MNHFFNHRDIDMNPSVNHEEISMKEPNLLHRIPRRQRGLTMTEMLGALAVVAILIAVAVPFINGAIAKTRLQQAYVEINDLLIAGEQYRAQNGGYGTGATAVTVTRLVSRGYLTRPDVTDGTNENVYGLSMAMATAAGGDRATVTYGFPDGEACLQMRDALDDNARLTVSATDATACPATNVLTFTLN